MQFLSHETETVHSCIELDMHREVLHSPTGQHITKCPQRIHIRYARLQPAVNHLVEKIRTGSQHKYRKTDSGFSKLDSLYRIGHCKVVGALFLEH